MTEPVGVERAKVVTGHDPDEPPAPPAAPGLPIRVAAVDDYEVVVEGLAAMLSRFPDRLHVCEAVLQGEPVEGDEIDVALYDTYGRIGVSEPTLQFLSAMDGIRHVAVFTMDVTADLVHDALAAGADAVLSKKTSGEDLADALIRVALGEQVILGMAETDHDDPGDADVDWPGRIEGLSLRESEVLALVADGHTNREIAAALYVGLEAVKSHLKAIYRKLGVSNRTQAARYAALHQSFREGPSARNDVTSSSVGHPRP
jgi:DNA-binding NarL/FixJ family response regulator